MNAIQWRPGQPNVTIPGSNLTVPVPNQPNAPVTVPIPGTGGVTPYQPVGGPTITDGQGNPLPADAAAPRAGEVAGESSSRTVLYDANGQITTDEGAARLRQNIRTQQFVTPGSSSVINTEEGYDPNRAPDRVITDENGQIINIQTGPTQERLVSEDAGFAESNAPVTRTTNDQGQIVEMKVEQSAITEANTSGLVQPFRAQYEGIVDETFAENLANTGLNPDGSFQSLLPQGAESGAWASQSLNVNDVRRQLENVPVGQAVVTNDLGADGHVVAINTGNGNFQILYENLSTLNGASQTLIDINTGERVRGDQPGATWVQVAQGENGAAAFYTFKRGENGELIVTPSTPEEQQKALTTKDSDGNAALQMTDNILNITPSPDRMFTRVLENFTPEFRQTLEQLPPELREVVIEELEKRGDIPEEELKIILQERLRPWERTETDVEYRINPMPVEFPAQSGPSPDAGGVSGANSLPVQPVDSQNVDVNTTIVQSNRAGQLTGLAPGSNVPLPENQPSEASRLAVEGQEVPRLTVPVNDQFVITGLPGGEPIVLESDLTNARRYNWGGAGTLYVIQPEGMSDRAMDHRVERLMNIYHNNPLKLDAAINEKIGETYYSPNEIMAPGTVGQTVDNLNEQLPTMYVEGQERPPVTFNGPGIRVDHAGEIGVPTETTNPQFFITPPMSWAEMTPEQRDAAQVLRYADPGSFTEMPLENAAILQQIVPGLPEAARQLFEGYRPQEGDPASGVFSNPGSLAPFEPYLQKAE